MSFGVVVTRAEARMASGGALTREQGRADDRGGEDQRRLIDAVAIEHLYRKVFADADRMESVNVSAIPGHSNQPERRWRGEANWLASPSAKVKSKSARVNRDSVHARSTPVTARRTSATAAERSR